MKEIDNILIKQVEKNKTPSVQYIIFNTDSIIHRFQFGLADIKNKINTSENTTYNVFSVTKTFTALAIMQLTEQKKIDIDQSIRNYLSGFPYSPEITVRQLMTHSAGIPNPVPLGWIHRANEHQSFDRNNFFREVFSKNSKTKSKHNENKAY